jgi:hypothetical protein
VSVDPETIGAIIEGAAGLFGGGGGAAKRYAPTEKRTLLLAAARQYGYDSPEYKQLAARWPRQAKKLEKFGRVAAPPSSAATAQQPLGYVFDPFRMERGISVGGYDVTNFPPNTGEVWSQIFTTFGGISSLGKALLSALFKRRAKKTIAQVVKKVATATTQAKAKGLTGKGARLEAEKILAAEAKSTAAKKVGPIAIKAAAKTTAKGRALGRAVVGGTAAGTAAQIVQEIIAKARKGELKPPGTGATATPAGGATAPSGAASVGGMPVGSSPSGTSAAPGRSATATAQGLPKPQSATAAAGEKARRAAAAYVPPGTIPEWLQITIDTARQLGFPKRGEAGRERPLPEVPVVPQPFPSLGAPGLTGFRGPGVTSCECKPKRARGPRKKRTVCYTGRFSETATGTIKYEKRRRTSCLPSRKRPASARAQ